MLNVDVLVMTSGLRFFDVIWSWNFENIHKLTCQLISHFRHGTMIKSISLKCQIVPNADQITLQMWSDWENDIDQKWKEKCFPAAKCQDTSCHVQTLIWDLLNGPDQVVLFQSIGVYVLLLTVKIHSWELMASWFCYSVCFDRCTRWLFYSNLFPKLLPIGQLLKTIISRQACSMGSQKTFKRNVKCDNK